MELPKKYKHSDVEKKWQMAWEKEHVYTWDSSQPRENTFSIDTPPPTVSGSLHVGHVFSYTHTDLLARFQRMQGKTVFYPMGWDDNGLPTERRVQNIFKIRCNPNIPYNPDWKPSKEKGKKDPVEEVARQNFIEACEIITLEDEQAFETMWRHLGLSVDWSIQYATINDHCRQLSQYSFLDLVSKDAVESKVAPNMWDVDFKTAVAQAEIEDRDIPGAYHDIRFDIEGGGDFVISTTRPELLAACIAVVAHPNDDRYKPLFGKYAITPLFSAKVPILPAEHADPEKGSGILMICTFGDIADVDWWKQSGLPVKQIIGRNGRLNAVDFTDKPFFSLKPKKALTFYDQLKGLRVKQAQKAIVELLKQPNSGYTSSEPALIGEPKSITHPVKFYEKGDSPLEYVPTRQWFIKLIDHKQTLLDQGKAIQWHPAYMQKRYENWVEGINQDWCISRQRFFGVPFPVWYPLDASGEANFDSPIFASKDQLPIDPMITAPKEFNEEQRDQPNGFTADKDVMDTWATSSLTPQLTSHWILDKDRHKHVFPMDIRPQSHEIIRTWAFYTITKAWLHEETIPWYHVVISGWVLDPDRKKMSKSKGNVITPTALLDEYSADAVRYWTAKARLGVDTAFDTAILQIGQKLCTKLFNASKFVLMQLADHQPLPLSAITEPLDCDFIKKLDQVVLDATSAFEAFDYAKALDVTETLFWAFCDHYIELVKGRAYREENIAKKNSALASLDYCLNTFLTLFAPFLPYVTEEIWSWRYKDLTHKTSIHLAKWPQNSGLSNLEMPIFDVAVSVLSQIRTAKTQQQKPLNHPLDSLQVSCCEHEKLALERSLADLERAGRFEIITFTHHAKKDDIQVQVTFS